jgi:hypothetical protein
MAAVPQPNPRVLAAGAMENRFRAAVDAVSAYIRGGEPQTTGAAEFAILHLVSRSLNDLGWAQYLASSGYPIQAYSVMRPVLESLRLVDLFVQEPDAAQRWAEGEWREFMPARVRERLGIERDPLYAFLSEHSHPRFAGLHVSAYRRVGDEANDRGPQRAILYMGEIPFEVPPVLMATTLPGVLLSQVALAAGHVRLSYQAALGWSGVLRSVATELAAGWAEVDAQLPPMENDEGELVGPLGFIREAAEELRQAAEEADAMVAEAHGESDATSDGGDGE